jgi:hypothetical protein
MIYEITNPSDPYTLDAPEPIIACAAVLALSGDLGVKADDGSFRMNPRTQDQMQWFADTFGDELATILKDRAGEVAHALDTVADGQTCQDCDSLRRQAHIMAACLRKIAKINNAAGTYYTPPAAVDAIKAVIGNPPPAASVTLPPWTCSNCSTEAITASKCPTCGRPRMMEGRP